MTPRAGPGRRLLPWLGAVAAVLLLGGALYFLAHRQVARVRAGLPARPDLAHFPAAMQDEVAAAEARALRRAGCLEGVQELGLLYQANGFSAEADACWRLLAREQPGEARWRYLQADLRRRDSLYPEMADLLRQTVELAPAYAPAWLKLADHELKSVAFDDAAAHYARRLSLLPADPYGRLGLVRLALLQGRTAEARQRAEELLAIEPRFSAAQNLYAEMLAAAGDPDGARLHRWLGREAGRFKEADDPWLDELNDRLFDPAALELLAMVRYQTGQADRGRGALERAARLAPDRPQIHESLGNLCLKLGDPRAARAALEQGLAATAGRASIPLFVYLNQACRETAQGADALRYAQQGLAVHPGSHELFNALGQTWEILERPPEALAAYRRAVALSPGDAECNFNLAALLLQLGQLDEALPYLRASLTLQPTFPKSLKLLARLALDSGRLDEAGGYLTPLHEAQPGDPMVRDLLIEWHLSAGRPAAARAILREAREIARQTGDATGVAQAEEALRKLP